MTQPGSFDHWSRYWQTGHLTSLPEDFSAIYDGEIEAFWAARVRDLPAAAAVLDVCTGNGPVALLIARHASDARIWAADAADVDPTTTLSAHPALAELAERITFLSATPAETVDGLAQHFDLVTSQYGVEYTDWTASARAMAAALKPGGRLALVAHVPTSAMVKAMEAEQAEYKLLNDSEVLQALRELGEKGSGSARKRLKRTVIRLRPRAVGSALLDSVVHGAGALLNMDPVQLQSQQPAIRQYVTDLVAGRDRARDLLETNQRILATPRWFEAFAEAGLELVSEETLLYQGEHECGVALVFHKPEA